MATFVWGGVMVEDGREGARVDVRDVPVGDRGLCWRIEAAARERVALERRGRRRKVEENSLVVVGGGGVRGEG